MATANSNLPGRKKLPAHPFRKAVLRGLGVVSPPLFTILIFAWVIGVTRDYVFEPVVDTARWTFVEALEDVRTDLELTDPATRTAVVGERAYRQLDNGEFVPETKYAAVYGQLREKTRQLSGREVYEHYVNITFLSPYKTIPFLVAVFVLLLYLLGKFMAAGIGRFSWNMFEQGIHRLPLVRTVYSSVKQVSDFLFSEREIEYTRVVAVEYPRRGIWSLGFVTGESMLDIRSAANEPVLSVLMCTSPMPMTGFTCTVPKRDCIDLNITIDQAFQFIISCGVVVPPQQLREMVAAGVALPEPQETEDPDDQDGSPKRRKTAASSGTDDTSKPVATGQ